MTLEEFDENYSYNKHTGIVTRVRNAGRFLAGTEAGTLSDTGYIKITYKYKKYRAHHLAFLAMTGEYPKHGVDHINHNRADNRWSNLSDTSQLDNNRNRSIQSNNSSGYHGVRYCKRDDLWSANIKVNGKVIYLGGSKSKQDCINMRTHAEKLYGFHENHGVKNYRQNCG